MPRIPPSRRLSEEEFEAMVAAKMPRVLGLLLSVVAGILANPDERPDCLPRMADFEVWIARARPALGWPRELFTEAYQKNQESAGDAVMESDPIAPAIIELLDSNKGRWQGNATELLAALPIGDAVRKQKGFPAPNTISERLTRLQNTLAAEGVEIAFHKASDASRKRTIVLKRSPAAPPP
jgi:hypothetical protein